MEMKRKVIEKMAMKNNSNKPICFKTKEENLFIMNLWAVYKSKY